MEPLPAFVSIAVAITIGAISPGPSFILVARTAVAASRRSGLAAALGMGLGGLLFAALAVLGLQAVLAQAPVLYVAVRLLGGAYLLLLAYRLWRGAAEPLAVVDARAERSGGGAKAFAVGFATQISNPKTAIAYASIFAALLPAAPPPWLAIALPLLTFSVETLWYALVALAFSSPAPRAAYLRCKHALDRIAASVLGALGFKLVWDAARPA